MTTEEFPPRNHEWTLAATEYRSAIHVVAICRRCGQIRVVNAKEARSINLTGQCWRST